MAGLLTIALSVAALAATSETEALAHWPMEIVQDGVVRDMSTNALHIQVKGEMPDGFIRTGAFGNAAFFGNARNWLEAPSSPVLGLRDDFTISCAIYPLSVDGFRTILWKGDRTLVPEAVNYYVDLRDGKVELKAKDAEGRWVVHSTAPVVKPNVWHSIVVTYAGGTVRIWVNGEECTVHTGENGELDEGLLPNDGPLMIGAGANSQGIAYGFLGLIDEVLIRRGAWDGPSEKDMALWRETVNGYERRRALARLGTFRERIGNQRAEALPPEETALLDNLDAIREQAAETDTETIEETIATVRAELDKLGYREFYRKTAADAPFLVIPLRTSDRVVKKPRFFEDIGAIEEAVSLEAARNECEGFQLVVTPGFEKKIERVSAEITGLMGPNGNVIPEKHLEWGWIRPIETEMPDIPVPFVGWIPDAIIEGAAPPPIAPYDFECLYVRVFVPRDTAPGNYSGVVTVKADSEKRDIGIRLRVHAFALPETTPLKMAFSFFEQFYEDWYGLEKVPRETQRELYEFLLEYRIPPNNIYSSKTTCPDLDYLQQERERMTFFTYSTGEPNPGTGTPEGVQESIDRIEAVHNTLKQADLLENAYFYCFDELAYNAHHIPAARRLLVPLRERIPGIRVMQTSFPVESIRDLFNVWCPIIHHFDRPEDRRILEELRAEDNEIWWYMADSPRHPFPNLFLDYPPFDARILGVLSYMYDVEGVLYWCINREWKTNLDTEPRWPEGDWKAHIYHMHTGVRKQKNGMGNLIYPGPEGRLYPSLRLENLRDGIEDHACLTLLARWVQVSGDAHAAALLEIPGGVAIAASDYNPKPERLLDYRRRIAEVLDKAALALDQGQ